LSNSAGSNGAPKAGANGAPRHQKPGKNEKPSATRALEIDPAQAPAAVDGATLNKLESPEIQEKLRELVKLAKEQGYITFDDLSEICRTP